MQGWFRIIFAVEKVKLRQALNRIKAILLDSNPVLDANPVLDSNSVLDSNPTLDSNPVLDSNPTLDSNPNKPRPIIPLDVGQV